MTKAELITTIHNRLRKNSTISRRLVKEVVEEFVGSITDSLIEGQEISIEDLGKFYVTDHPPRIGHSPRTREPVTIKAYKVVRFLSSPDLKKRLN